MNEPIVRRLIDVFEGRLMDIRPANRR